VVNVVPAEHAEIGRVKHATAAVFYRLFGRLSEMDSTASVGDFRLLSRRAVDALRAMPERARFLRGMSAWIGYRHTTVPYRPAARFAGRSKYPPRRMLRLAMDGLTSFSAAPLRLVSALGLCFVVFCVLYLAYVLGVHFFTDETIEGWTSVVALILLIGGVQMLSLGMVGQYVARVFDEAKQRPLYLLDAVFEEGRLEDGRLLGASPSPVDAIGVTRPRAPTRTP